MVVVVAVLAVLAARFTRNFAPDEGTTTAEVVAEGVGTVHPGEYPAELMGGGFVGFWSCEPKIW